MRRRLSLDAQQGFTLIELMVAAFVLLAGVGATVTVVTQGLRKTTLDGQRVAATNLGRQLTEAARTATYNQLAPTTVVSAIQAVSSDLGTGTPWTIQRRNTVFTITATACTYDDPADKLADPPVADRCALDASTPTTTGDQSGDDFRRVQFTITWKESAKTYRLRQTALVVNPSGGLGPKITTPFPAAPATNPLATVTSGTSLSFPVTTTYADSLHWNTDDGVSGGNASGGHFAWTISWDLGAAGSPTGVLDGTYSISAQPFDDRGIAGESKTVPVTINRVAPFAPTGFNGGHDLRNGDWVDLEWQLNPERDIVGYRVFYMGADNAIGGGDDVQVCPSPAATPSYLPNTSTSCQDTSPPVGSGRYYIRALDYDNAATPNLRNGADTTLSIGNPNTAPNVPTGLTLGAFAPPTLTWTQAASGGAPAFYRVYRDGTQPSNRIAKVTVGTSYVDNGGDDGDPHQYWITAVDSSFNESALVGPVQWNGG